MNNLYFIPDNVVVFLDAKSEQPSIEKILFSPGDPWRGFEKDIKIAFKNSKRITESMMKSITRFYTAYRYYDNAPLIFHDIPFNYIVQTLPKLDTKAKKIIINPPATIIIWEDGTKTVVKADKEDEKAYDPEKGVLFCYLKKLMGKSYYQTITDLLNGDNLVFQFAKKIIFNDQMTIVIWDDGTKTYAKCNESRYDEEKGLAVCLLKKMIGGSVYINTIKPQVENALKELVSDSTENFKPFLYGLSTFNYDNLPTDDVYRSISNDLTELGNKIRDVHTALAGFVSYVNNCVEDFISKLGKNK